MGFHCSGTAESIYAPTFLRVLKGCTDVKRHQRAIAIRGKGKASTNEGPVKTVTSSHPTILCDCAAILLQHKNTHMNLMQRVLSLLLNAGHTSKQVQDYCILSPSLNIILWTVF